MAKDVLARAREAYDGQLMIIKGPHTASLYPAAHTRQYSDLDVLVDDPDRAQRALIGAGFLPLGNPDDYYFGLHHLRPLGSPGEASLTVEVHRRPNWFAWSDPPPVGDLLGAGIPDVLGIEGVLGLPPAHHALILAAHSWVELPLRRLSDIVDVAAAASLADSGEIDALARRWGMERVWRTTRAAIRFLLFDEPPHPSSLRLWARNLESVRDRTVMETHVRHLMSSFWARPPVGGVLGTGRALMETVLPAPSDTWATKLARARIAFISRSRPIEEHRLELGESARTPPRFRRR
jgi:hypothetical protein